MCSTGQALEIQAAVDRIKINRPYRSAKCELERLTSLCRMLSFGGEGRDERRWMEFRRERAKDFGISRLRNSGISRNLVILEI